MLLAVYGTLRKRGRLHGYVQGHEPLSTERVEGYAMYTLRSYPYIAREAESITVEVYDLPESVYERIADMECGAGYTIGEVKTTQGKAKIFYFDDKRHARYQATGNYPRILSGDWLQWVEKYSPEDIRKDIDI